jgi:hypothetical protein
VWAGAFQLLRGRTPTQLRGNTNHHLLINGNRVFFTGNKAAEAWNWPLAFIKRRSWEVVALFLKFLHAISRHGAQLRAGTNFIHSAVRGLRFATGVDLIRFQWRKTRTQMLWTVFVISYAMTGGGGWKYLMPNIHYFVRGPRLLSDLKVSIMWSPAVYFTSRTWRFRLPEY